MCRKRLLQKAKNERNQSDIIEFYQIVNSADKRTKLGQSENTRRKNFHIKEL
jgi:hypothetical protein